MVVHDTLSGVLTPERGSQPESGISVRCNLLARDISCILISKSAEIMKKQGDVGRVVTWASRCNEPYRHLNVILELITTAVVSWIDLW